MDHEARRFKRYVFISKLYFIVHIRNPLFTRLYRLQRRYIPLYHSPGACKWFILLREWQKQRKSLVHLSGGVEKRRWMVRKRVADPILACFPVPILGNSGEGAKALRVQNRDDTFPFNHKLRTSSAYTNAKHA